MSDIEIFIKNHIKEINRKISDFKESQKKGFNDTQIKDFLQEKLAKKLEDPSYLNHLTNALKKHHFIKARIEDIANEEILYKNHLTDIYESIIYKNIFNNVDLEKLKSEVSESIKKQTQNEPQYKFIKSNLEKLLSKSLYVLSKEGFSSDINNTQFGLRVANEGDSAQFLFLARAISAGFNCSNVDVRSSGYDAIIDVNSKLLKIQIKGVQGNNISFWNRARGGQGIDSKHERNQQKRITKKDCDLYVAVDKQIGICYIIPMSYADSLSDDDSKNINVDKLSKFRENWSIIKELTE